MAEIAPASALYGVMAEFTDATELMRAAKAAYAEGFRHMDAYTAAPVHGLAEAMGHDDRRVQKLTFAGGVLGLLGGFGLCYWTSVIDYPLNIGGRPLNSWPAFIPVTFEITILIASITAVLSWILLNGLPLPYHPVFNVPRFAEIASEKGFFLTIESSDPKFDRQRTVDFLKALGAKDVNEIAH